MYSAMTDGHCMLCLRHDTRPRPKGKRSMIGGGGGGAPLIGLPTQQLHSHHATDKKYDCCRAILQGLSYKVCFTMLPIFLQLDYLFCFWKYLPLYTNSLLLCMLPSHLQFFYSDSTFEIFSSTVLVLFSPGSSCCALYFPYHLNSVSPQICIFSFPQDFTIVKKRLQIS